MANASSNTGTKLAAGLGLAALAAAAASTYYFYGNKGKQHRRELKAWGKKARTEMVQRIKKMRTFSKQAYDTAAKEVMAKYKQAKNIEPAELSELGKELKSYWGKISKDISKLGTKSLKSKKTS